VPDRPYGKVYLVGEIAPEGKDVRAIALLFGGWWWAVPTLQLAVVGGAHPTDGPGTGSLGTCAPDYHRQHY